MAHGTQVLDSRYLDREKLLKLLKLLFPGQDYKLSASSKDELQQCLRSDSTGDQSSETSDQSEAPDSDYETSISSWSDYEEEPDLPPKKQFTLRQKLHEAFIHQQNDSKFIPLDTLKKIVNLSAVLEELQESSPRQRLSHYEALRIVDEAPKLFAILVVIAQSQTIVPFLSANLGDKDLPFRRRNAENKNSVVGRFDLVPYQGVGSSSVDPFEHWQPRQLKEFEKTQWVTLAPYFKASESGSPLHYQLDARDILPFVDESRTSSTPQGGYSTVWAVKIHPQHDGLQSSVAIVSRILKRRDKTDTQQGEQPLYAIKRLNSTNRRDFEKEKAALERFSSNSNPHLHLIKLLATYEHNKQFHLVFPFANDDLRGYWAHHIPQFNGPAVTWLLKQLHGLVSGLGALHGAMLPASTKLRSHLAEQMQFRHGDLKPENILWFEDDAGGTLKIADLGLGGFHKHSRVTPETVISTVTYAPPELDHSMKENISQAFDVWSLGCVYLEFITWLLTGSDGVEAFADERLSMTFDGIKDDAFYQINRDRTESSVPVQVRPSVVDWVEKLHENPACSQVVHELLDIILDEMLAAVPSERSSASKLQHELHVLLLRAEKDQHFLLDPQPISFETTPDDLIENTDTTYLDAASSSLPSNLAPDPIEPPKTYTLRPLSTDTNESYASAPGLGEGLYKRILSPREYFSPLQSLEQTMTECSVVNWQVADTMSLTDKRVDLDQVRTFGKRLITHADGTGYPMQLPPPFPEIERFDEYIAQICTPGKWSNKTYFYQRGEFLDILKNTKAIHQVRKNVERMQEDQFCAGKISLLILDANQRSIGRLISIDVSILEAISAEFDELVHIYVLGYILNKWEGRVPEYPTVLRSLKKELWVQLGLHSESSYLSPDGSLPEIWYSDSLLPELWYWSITISALDLGVVSFAGAHIESFNEHFGDSKMVNIRVGGYLGRSTIKTCPIFRQRRLKCLDKFLRGLPVWVLHPDDQDDDCRLLLGSEVETFSDTWGPMWKCFDDNIPGEIRMFAVGNGCLIRATSLNDLENIELSENETYCHWIADEEVNTISITDLQPIPANANLLIGAGQFSPLRIKECQRTVSSVRTRLKNRNCLRVPGTASATKYLDGENWAVQAGLSIAGVSATATHQRAYKRRAGQPLKAALVELWGNEPDMRDFHILDMICGVRISWCTQHAQRVRLLDILRSDTMLSYLSRWKPFVDDKDAHTAYIDRIRSNDFDASWIIQNGTPEERKLIGDAILICLKALNQTGVVLEGDDEGSLQALWAPPRELEMMVVIAKRGHEWIGLLEDTVTNGSMVIFEPVCLKFQLPSIEQTPFAKCQYMVRRRNAPQGTSSLAVLQTALDVNNEFPEPIPGVDRVAATETEHAWRDNVDGICRRWTFSDEVNGFKIELGPRTYLQVVNKHKEFLLVHFSTFVVPGGVLNIGRRRPEGYHRELIDHKRRVALEPISLCVL